MNMIVKNRWVRSHDGILGGVCSGLAKSFGWDPVLIRLALLASVIVFGTGILAYLVLWIALPKETDIMASNQKRLLGVSTNLAHKTGIEVGLIRAMWLVLALMSFGTATLGYIIVSLWFHLSRPKLLNRPY
ncbi:MAG: PspC domain-containing protein [Pseudobacteriovorax sp.]|nr:PspC domain-containing protein [Pseudobacteriovorax sp.]